MHSLHGWVLRTRLINADSVHFFRRYVRLKLCQQDDLTVRTQLVGDIDDSLFETVLANLHHVLFHILPDINYHSYSLRPGRHGHILTETSLKDNHIIL